VPKNWIQTGLVLIAVAICVLLTFIAGLFTFMKATANPIHPNPKAVPSLTRSAPPAKWADAVARSREIVRADLAGQNLPGVSVAVGADGDTVWAEGFGFSDLDRRAPVAPETQFKIADVSMTLTSAAVGLLAESGRLNLDDGIQMYVPTFPEKQWPVTLRQLMGHVAGVRTDAGDEEPIAARCERTVDGLERFADRALLFEPGTRFRPSTYGWILVSAAVEAAAGEPFFAFMRTRIFEPLGMAATRPDSATEPLPNRATVYFPRFAGDPRYGPDLAREGDHRCFAGAGAFLSTPSDLVRFGIALGGGRLLQPATVKVLQTPGRLASGEETGYGLGWRLETVPLAGASARMASHDTKRDFIGGTASLMTFPDHGIVVAVTSNISFADTRPVALKIAQVFAESGKVPAGK
jgi:CubicO group peptidase (beta-lactamase class C family)